MKISHLLPYMKRDCVEAGCDEAGRGCLAGPVFAAAVILPPDFSNERLNDSKQLSEKQREALRIVVEREAVCFSVAWCTPDEIDEINILWASVKAMHKALSALPVRPGHILVDGNRFKSFENVPHTCVVKGDGKYLSIAAASVLAKTYRDEHMLRLHAQFPVYEWNRNKGYPTKKHRDAILSNGITVHHRRSFQLVERQLKLGL